MHDRFLFAVDHSSRSVNETDRVSLLELKAEIEEDPLGLLSSWNESAHFCLWPGVTCSRRHSQRVTRLDLRSWKLKGKLSPHVGNLSFLRTLNLANNSLRQAIPPEIGRLFRLRVLNMRNNSFGGEIPANVSGCSSLQLLLMMNNDLTGRIPKEIGLLSRLRSLELTGNSLVGEIPASIGNLSLLSDFRLMRNKLQGAIPHSLSWLKSLEALVLAYNNLRGTIPLSLYNISTLEYLAVSSNELEGSLPPNLGHALPNLRSFYFNENNFTGSIPATVSNVSNLVRFQVNANNFIGKVPSLSRSSKLHTLAVFDNNLGYAGNGDLDFLRDLFNCTELENLSISENNLGGPIPETISNITSLKRLVLGQNRINGNIPTGIENLVNLEGLGMEFNHLTGPIPNTIGKLRKMNILSFEANKLSGTIPSTLGNLTLLSGLSFASNNLHGSIPPSLGECKNLQQLYLNGNNLSGSIPLQVVSLQSLSIVLDLSKNHLTGSIPVEAGKLVNLGTLDISENKLSGEIPETLGSCIRLEFLNLRGNFLEGSIPRELESLRGVLVIDLSHNKLSGKIPGYFANFMSLVYLNLSFNDFEGQVPPQGVFKNVSRFSVAGNTRLCGGLPELKLRSCTSIVNNSKKLSPRTKLVIIVSCSITAFIFMLFFVMLCFRSRTRSKPISEPSVGISLPRASYGDLFKATDGFSSEKLIGVGNFGSVYKGKLNQEDTLVAVKVLNLHVSRALKSFVSECESLRIIKHRNLVKILTVCSSIDFQGNDFKGLVYEFMENGNLDEWLHSCQSRVNNGQEQSRGLDLIQRVSIAVDVASALDYLHNHGPESIAHCDIKPSNILLDGHMVAHVGDFGLAKLLKSALSTSSHESSSIGVRGTVGYVAPEYAMGSEVSTLGDIYSFGILLLEMFTGKRPTDSMFKDDFNLNNFASAALPESISEVLDPMLLEQEHQSSANTVVYRYDDKDQTVHKSLVSIVEIGVACSSTLPVERRSISDVAAELRRVRDTLDVHRLA